VQRRGDVPNILGQSIGEGGTWGGKTKKLIDHKKRALKKKGENIDIVP